MRSLRYAFVSLALVAAATAFAAEPEETQGWRATAAAPSGAKVGAAVDVPVTIEVLKDHYIYKPRTEVHPGKDAAVTVGAIAWPKPDGTKPDPRTNEPEDVYDTGSHVFPVKVTFTKAGSQSVTLDVKSQACNAVQGWCLFPATQPVTFQVDVAAAAPAPTPTAKAAAPVPTVSTIAAIATATPNATPAALAIATPAPSLVSATGSVFSDQQRMAEVIRDHFLLALLIAFAGGLLISGTPCVYPMIPITVSVIGAQVAGKPSSRSRGFFLSLIYVAGITIVYATLGLVAALSNRQFAFLLQSPWVRLGVAAVFLALAASMFGAFSIQLPGKLQTKLLTYQGNGWIGVFVTGLFAGVVAGPCTAPVLLGILVAISAGSVGPAGGFALMTSFSLGMGVLFILLGTFAGLLSTLPQSGPWMERVKYAFGALLAAAALYYVKLAVPPFAFFLALGAALVLAGVALGVGRALAAESGPGARVAKAAGTLAFVAGLWFFLGGLSTSGWGPDWLPHGGVAVGPGAPSVPTVAWNTDEGVARTLSQKSGKPMLVDFYADWCGDCKELDRKTYVDPAVIAEAASFVPLKIDTTENLDTTPERKALNAELEKRYGVKGLPKVTFVRPDGTILEDLSVTGFVPPDAFLERMRRAEAEARTCAAASNC